MESTSRKEGPWHSWPVLLSLIAATAEIAPGCGEVATSSGNQLGGVTFDSGMDAGEGGSGDGAPACGHLVLAPPVLTLPVEYSFVGAPDLVQTGDPDTVVLRYATERFDAAATAQHACRNQFLSPWMDWSAVQLTPAIDPLEGCAGVIAAASGMSLEVLESNGFLRNIAPGQPIGDPVGTIPGLLQGGNERQSIFLLKTDGSFLLGDSHAFYVCPSNPPDWSCSGVQTPYVFVREVRGDGAVVPPGDQIIGCGSSEGDAISVEGGELIAVASSRAAGGCPPGDQLVFDRPSIRVVQRHSGAISETAIIDVAPHDRLRLFKRSDGAWLVYDAYVARLDQNGRLRPTPYATPRGVFDMIGVQLFPSGQPGLYEQALSVATLGNRLVVTDGSTIDLLDENAQLVDAVLMDTHNARATLLGSPRGDSVIAALAITPESGTPSVQLARYNCAP